MFIRSERLFLRPAWPEDAHELSALGEAGPVMSNMPTFGVPSDDAAAGALIDAARTRRHPGFLMTLPSTSGTKIIGAMALARHKADGRGDDVQLGYWLSAAHWGQGYAAEAARAVLSLARALGHARVIAHQFVDDPASLLVLTRAGFRPTGRQRLLPTQGGKTALAAVYVADLGDGRFGGSGPAPMRPEKRAA